MWRGINMVSRRSPVCPSVWPSVRLSSVRPCIRFRTITWVNTSGFPPNLVCALILWRSGLGMLMGFRQCLTELPVREMPVFSFLDDNLIIINGFSPNLVCALILCKASLGLLMAKVVNFWGSYLPETCLYFRWWIFTKLAGKYAYDAFINNIIYLKTEYQEVAGSTPRRVGSILSWRLIT